MSILPKEISPEVLGALLTSPTPPLLLDVREPQERAAHGWINGAAHIPMMAIPERLAELDRRRDIVVYCAHGIRSYDVACYLLEQGFGRVASLDGGMADWDGPVSKS